MSQLVGNILSPAFLLINFFSVMNLTHQGLGNVGQAPFLAALSSSRSLVVSRSVGWSVGWSLGVCEEVTLEL